MDKDDQYGHYAACAARHLLDNNDPWIRDRDPLERTVSRSLCFFAPTVVGRAEQASAVAWGSELNMLSGKLACCVDKTEYLPGGQRITIELVMPVPLASAEYFPRSERKSFLNSFAGHHFARVLSPYIDDRDLQQQLERAFPDPRSGRELTVLRRRRALKRIVDKCWGMLPRGPKNRGYE